MDQKELDKFKCDGLLPSERVRNAAPALLEALELIVGDYEVPENYNVKIYCSKAVMEKAKAAIKQARGE